MKPYHKDISDYEFVSFLGGGAIARVYYARDKKTNEEVAIKVIPKARMTNSSIKQHILAERSILKEMDHRSIIKLIRAFQDKMALYFVLELAGKLNLNEHLIRWNNQLPFELSKFYTAEIIGILVYLRDKSVAHRDLKPENILVDDFGHLKLIDFNASIFVNSSASESLHESTDSPTFTSPSSTYSPSESQTSSSTIVNTPFDSEPDPHQLVGTYLYAAPEVLNMEAKHHFSIDLWALGCIAYKLFVGSPPFMAPTRSHMIARIRSVDYSFPESLPDIVKDFISKLLILDPEKRLGAQNINEIYNHPLFNGMDVRMTHLTSPPLSPRPLMTHSSQDYEATSLANDLDALELTPNIGETFPSLKPLISMS